jgi:MEMO1 family protein
MNIQRQQVLKSLLFVVIVLLCFSCTKTPFWSRSPQPGPESAAKQTAEEKLQESTRPARFAGSWYESNPLTLKGELDNYLKQAQVIPDSAGASRLKAENQPLSGDVLAIIVPHAGYTFSGQTAAYAYKSAQGSKVKRVFILGPSHHSGFEGIALPPETSFATPFGNLEVDTEVIAGLKKQPLFITNSELHAVEHSLELQLPFIKSCYGNVKIVPMVVGQIRDEIQARRAGEALKGYVHKGDLIVVSSDFTHYGPRYDYFPFGTGSDAPKKVAQMDGEAFKNLSKADLEGFTKFLQRTNDTICGMHPIQVMLSMLPKGAHGTLLKYATSRDSVAEDKENAVSYLAIAFTGAEWPAAASVPARGSTSAKGPGKATEAAKTSKTEGPPQPSRNVVGLNETERQTLLKLARSTIETYVKENRVVSPEELKLKITDAMKKDFACFVTITRKTTDKRQPERGELRGCIGNIFPDKPLYKAVQDNAVSACSRDHRFNPVAPSELPSLQYEISILTRPQPVAGYKEIVVGRDGVILYKGMYQAVFLPQVAVEWNWGLEEMLSQLSLKAGLGPSDWRDGTRFETFQAEIIH